MVENEYYCEVSMTSLKSTLSLNNGDQIKAFVWALNN